MIKQSFTRCSYYDINHTNDISSGKYHRVNINDKFQLVYDLKAGKGIAVVSTVLCRDPKTKTRRYRELKNIFNSIRTKNESQLSTLVEVKRADILKIFNQ